MGLEGEDQLFAASRAAIRECFSRHGVHDVRVVVPIARDEVVFVIPYTAGGGLQDMVRQLIALLERKVHIVNGASYAWEAQAHPLEQ